LNQWRIKLCNQENLKNIKLFLKKIGKITPCKIAALRFIVIEFGTLIHFEKSHLTWKDQRLKKGVKGMCCTSGDNSGQIVSLGNLPFLSVLTNVVHI